MVSTTSSAGRMKSWRKCCSILCRDGKAPIGNCVGGDRSTFPCYPLQQLCVSRKIAWSRKLASLSAPPLFLPQPPQTGGKNHLGPPFNQKTTKKTPPLRAPNPQPPPT